MCASYSFAKSPFNAAKAPLARARTIQGEVEDFGGAVEDILAVYIPELDRQLLSRGLITNIARFGGDEGGREEFGEVRGTLRRRPG